MNTLKYKGFLGTVSFSEEDAVFFGKIEGIDALVNFEGKSVSELIKSFHEAVDDYLIYCSENGIEARKTYSGTLNIRISPITHGRIAELAAEAGVTINAFINAALDREVSEPQRFLSESRASYGSGRKSHLK